MLVDDLVAYDLVPSELAALRAVMPERLLPLQVLSVRRGILVGDQSLLIAAGPGAGKSTLAELAVLHAAHVGQRALLLKPGSAAELRQLVLKPQRLDALELLVVDGLDVGQDSMMELLLRHLSARKRAGAPGPRLIGLCEVVEGAEALSKRLDAELIVGERAPAAMLGVLGGGRIVYRAQTPQGRAEEDLGISLRTSGSLLGMLGELVRRGQQTLVVWPDAARCVRMAERLAAGLGRWGSPAVRALDELAGTAPGRAQAVLAETLRRGVAICTPDLTPRQRRLVERAVMSGEVRLLCTSELLPEQGELATAPFANVVVSTSWRWQRDRESGRWQRADLDARELARLAGGSAQRRTLLYARTRGESEMLWQRYIESAGARLAAPPVAQAGMSDAVGCLIGSGVAQSEAAVVDWLDGTISKEELPKAVSLAVAELRSAGVIPVQAGLKLTAWGQVAVECGLPPRTAQIWGRWVESSLAAPAPTPLEAVCIASLGPGALPLPLLLSEQPLIDYGARLLERAEVRGLAERPLFRWLRKPANQLSHETLRAMKRALLLHDWIEGVSGPTIENTYHIWIGNVGRIAEDLALRVEVLERMYSSAGSSTAAGSGLKSGLGELARRLRARPVDSVAEHQAAPPAAIGRAIGGVMGALHAQKNAAQKTAEAAEVIPIGKVRSA